MRAVWMLRGEAPDEPTEAQLSEADGWVRDLTEIPAFARVVVVTSQACTS